MAYVDLTIGQTIQLTCIYMLAIQVPTLLTLEAIANLPESNPEGQSDIAEFAGQAPADGIPIALGISSTDSEHKLKNRQAHAKSPHRSVSSKVRKPSRSASDEIWETNKGGLTTQRAEPIYNDPKLLEQKLRLLQLIDQLGFDEALQAFRDQLKSDSDYNSEGIQPSTTSKPAKSRSRHPKTEHPKSESPLTLELNDTQAAQVSDNQPQRPQMDTSNLERYSGFNGTLEQTVSMTIPRNQNPKNLAAPPHHQTNVYIQQTKFHNRHQDISDKSNTQNEQVVVASPVVESPVVAIPVVTAEYVINDDDDTDDYKTNNDKVDPSYDDDRRKPIDEQIREAINQIIVPTQKPTEKPKPRTIKPARRTRFPKRLTTPKQAIQMVPTTQPSTKVPFDFLTNDFTERIEPVVKCPTFLEFVIEAQVFWTSLKESSGIVNSFELVVHAIIQSMKTLGRCFYRVSSDVIQVIIDFFGVGDHAHNITAAPNFKRDIKG